LPLWAPLPAAATSSTPFFVAYLTAARSVDEVCEPLRLRLTMRAPWSTAQTMPAASSTSENVAPRFACTTISCAWPPKPAASEATKVPWPIVSSTALEPLVTL
jgi:hypothetical protein